MTYSLTDCFLDFEYHDAFIRLISLENGTLTLSAKHLNVHRDALREPLPYDMESENATVTLHAFTLHTLQKEAHCLGTDVDGNPILHNAVDYTREEMPRFSSRFCTMALISATLPKKMTAMPWS